MLGNSFRPLRFPVNNFPESLTHAPTLPLAVLQHNLFDYDVSYSVELSLILKQSLLDDFCIHVNKRDWPTFFNESSIFMLLFYESYDCFSLRARHFSVVQTLSHTLHKWITNYFLAPFVKFNWYSTITRGCVTLNTVKDGCNFFSKYFSFTGLFLFF